MFVFFKKICGGPWNHAFGSRFLLGLLRLIGLDSSDDWSVSLDLLAQPDVVKAVLEAMTSRAVKASRLYQIVSELRSVFVASIGCHSLCFISGSHVIAFVIESAHGHLSPKDKSLIRSTSFDSYNLVSSQLKETSVDKAAQARLRASMVVFCPFILVQYTPVPHRHVCVIRTRPTCSGPARF